MQFFTRIRRLHAPLLTGLLAGALSGCLLADGGWERPSAEPGVVRFNLGLERSDRPLLKAAATADTTFELDSLIVVLRASGYDEIVSAQPIAGRADTGAISLAPLHFELPSLRNWTATFYTIDESLSPFRRDTVHIDSVVFAVMPTDTAVVVKTVSPAFAILRARFLSSNADSIVNNVLWLRLRVDGVVRDSIQLGSSQASLNWLQAMGGSRLHALGDSGKMLRSTNNGASWTMQTIPGSPDMVAGFFPSEAIGFAVSRAGNLYKSADSGKTWDTRNAFADSVNSMFMTATDAGFAAGAGGGIYKFIGEGYTKHATISNTTQRINGLHFPGTATGYAVGENETILKTTNATANGWEVLWSSVAGGWFSQTSGTTNDIRGIHFLSANEGWVVGAGGYARRTTDGGATWVSSNILGGATANSVTFSNASTGWVAGDAGLIRRFVTNTDWGVVTTGTTQNLLDIRGVGNDTAFVVGMNGTLRRTTNGSQSPWNITWSGMHFPVSEASAWSTRNSTTTDNLNAVHFANANTGIAAGANRTVAITTDAGETWSSTTAGDATAQANAVYAASTTRFFVAGAGNGQGNSSATALRRSTNGGSSWSAVPIGTGGQQEIRGMTGTSANVAWIVGASNLLRSTNDISANNISWTDRNVGTGSYNAVNATSDNVWVVGDNAQIRRAWGKAHNAAFSVVNNSGLGSTNLRGVYFLPSNPSVGWVVGDGGLIARTTSGTWSVDWVVQGSPVTEDLVNVVFVNADTGYVTGANGTVLKTVNGGAVWGVQNTGTSANLTGLHVQNGNTVLAVGSGGAVIKTTSGGQQPSIAAHLRSVHPVTSSLVFVAGDSGIIGRTTNGGATWTKLNSGTTANLQSVHFADANVGWVVGAGGLIRKTTDGGANWSAQNGNTSASLRSVRAVSADTAYVTGANGTVLKTVNGGSTWYVQETPAGTPQLNRVHFLNPTVGFAVGMNGTILKAVNQGDNWTGGGIKRSLRGVYFVSTTSGWIVGADGIILKTTDGGATWVEQRRQVGQMLYGVKFRNANLGWVTGANGLILKTTNGGATWTQQTSNTSIDLRWVQFRDDNTGFVIGGTQSLLSTSNGGTNWAGNAVGAAGARTFDEVLTWKYLRPGQPHNILLEAIDRASPLRGYQSTINLTVGAGQDSTLVSPMAPCGYGGPACTTP